MLKNKKRNKYLLFLSPLVVFLFLGVGCASALEVKYPAIPGLPSLSGNNPGISEYIGYFFGLGVYLAGVLSLISFVIGAIGLINPDPEAHGAAKDRIKGAILGLVLTLASFLIIQTINPNLTNPITPLSSLGGVFLTNGSGEQQPCPEESIDTSTLPTGFNTIQYVCSDTGPTLLVWMYPNANFTGNGAGYDGITVKRVTCNNSTGISGKSFKTAFESPGVYYCLGGCSGDLCSGYMSNAITDSQSDVGSPFSKNIKSIRIVNYIDDYDPALDIYYGAVFHKEVGLENGGGCGRPITLDRGTDEGCKPVNTEASAVDIFKLNYDPGASGDGVSFYSEPYGWDVGANAGYLEISDDEITTPYSEFYAESDDAVTGMPFHYDGVNRSDQYQTECYTVKNCPGSIRIKGSYLVELYDENSTYCQTFTQDVPNLKAQPFRASGMGSLDTVFIVPTQ